MKVLIRSQSQAIEVDGVCLGHSCSSCFFWPAMFKLHPYMHMFSIFMSIVHFPCQWCVETNIYIYIYLSKCSVHCKKKKLVRR